MHKNKMVLGLGAMLIAVSSLVGFVACGDDDNDGGAATSTPSAGDTSTPAGDTTPIGTTPSGTVEATATP